MLFQGMGSTIPPRLGNQRQEEKPMSQFTIERGPESNYARLVVDDDACLDDAREQAREIVEKYSEISHVAVVTSSGRLLGKI